MFNMILILGLLYKDKDKTVTWSKEHSLVINIIKTEVMIVENHLS